MSFRFIRDRVNRCGHGGDFIRAMLTQIGTFREVLAQQPVGVLVGAALPRTLGIAAPLRWNDMGLSIAR